MSALVDDLPHIVVDIDPSHRLPVDGHPDSEGARQIAAAIAEALRARGHSAREAGQLRLVNNTLTGAALVGLDVDVTEGCVVRANSLGGLATERA